MEATERFVALLALPEVDLPLDEAAFLVAAHARPELDVDAELARLDELAATVHRERDAAGLAARLFGAGGFAGNRADYGDPRNSLLDQVLDRRLGIPISLSIVMLEAGRRIGIRLHGVGMPGHFLVGVDGDEDRFVDPFSGDAVLDGSACRARFAALHGPAAVFEPGMLAPTPSRAIVLRVLNNLERSYAKRRARDVIWVARLRLAFAELPAGDRRRTAALLGSFGAFGEGAAELEAIAADGGDEDAAAIAAEARALRARAN